MSSQMPYCREFTGLQLHYTSCRHGLSGHAGFQTRAMSSAIRPEEQRAIERLGVYQPPRSCPVEPDRNQIEDLFPVAYRHTYLETGRLALSRSTYAGKDYSGRWGNYFSHTLLIDQLPHGVWPVDVYEWKGWKKKLEETEDTDQALFDLPRATIVPDNAAFSFLELQDFLQEEDGRAQLLAQMIGAVFLRQETSRSLVIREELETNALFWIACIQKSFPSTHQKELSCSSYQFDPRACLAVNVTRRETDFSLGENERKFQFFVFDFLTEIPAEVSDQDNEYGSIISAWMSQHPETLTAFHTFSSQFEHNIVNHELVHLLRLFRLRIGESLFLDEQEIVEILDFINAYSKKEHLEDIIDIVAASIQQLAQSNHSDYRARLALFFINGAQRTQKAGFRTLAYEQIIQLVENMIVDQSCSLEEVEALRSHARDMHPSFDTEFAGVVLSSPFLSQLYLHIPSLTDQGLSLALSELLSAVQHTPENEALENQYVLAFIQHAVTARVPHLSGFEWLFSSFQNAPHDTARLCLYICRILTELRRTNPITQITKDDYATAIQSFSAFLSNLFQAEDEAYRFAVINRMKDYSEAWHLLEGEWRQSIEKQSDKISYHQAYTQHVLEQASPFSEAYRSVFADALWPLLSSPEQDAQAVAWIEAEDTKFLSAQLLQRVFQNTSANISFLVDDPQSDELCKLLSDKMEDFDIELQPDRLALRNAILTADNPSVYFDKKSLARINQALEKIEKDDYKNFTSSYLPNILTKTRRAEHHGLVIQAIFQKPYRDDFMKSYQAFFDQRKAKIFDRPDMAALQFWISLQKGDDDYSLYQNIYKESMGLLVSRIAQLKDATYEKLVRTNESNKKLPPDQKAKLQTIYAQVEKEKKALLRLQRMWRGGVAGVKSFGKKLTGQS